MSEKTEDKPTIDKTHLHEFVGEVKNLLKIDCHHLYANNYRINVWAVYRFPDRIVPDYVIEQSYFVSYDNEEIVDNTEIDVIVGLETLPRYFTTTIS